MGSPPAADSVESPPPEIPAPPEVEEEVHESASVRVDESELRAAFVEQGLEIRIPVEKLSSAALSGELELALLNDGGADVVELARGSVGFEQDEDREVHTVLLTNLPASWARGQTAPLVVEWHVRPSNAEDALSGLRSLYAALGPLELQLRGPSEVARGEGAPLRVMVRHRSSGEAIEGAQVRATLGVGGEVESALFEGQTDAYGQLVEQLVLPTGVDSVQVNVEVTHEDGQVWTSSTVRAITGSERLHLASDKTIYKPGQDVELRLLALTGPDRAPVVDTEAVFEAYDAKGLKVFKRTTKTDGFGAASVSVPTDTEINEGAWQFIARVGVISQALTLPVQQYILPKIAVDVRSDAAYALPGETIGGRIEARYLFGEPVANGTVQLTASAVGYSQLTEGSTDENGVFEFELPAPTSIASVQELALTATVTDGAGQRQVGSGGLRLSPTAVLVETLTEQWPVTRGVANRLIVLVSDPLGQPLVSSVEVTGLEDEAMTMTTNAAGIAVEPFTPGDDPTTLNLTATDGAERTGTSTFQLAPMARPDLVLKADRALYAAGDMATLSVQGARDLGLVYVDLFRDTVGVESVEVELTNGRGELSVPITADMGGMLVADAYAPTGEGTVYQASARLLVESKQRLRVSLTPSGDSFRPGQEAGLEVRVTDAEGNPKVAAVGLTVVNEATFALGGEPTANLERTFALDSPALPSTISVFGQTSLDLLNMPDSNDRQLLARALFARAAARAAVPMLPRFDYDSHSTELPQVLSSLQVKTSLDATVLVNALRAAFNGTVFTPELWFDTVEAQAKRLQDPFGQRYSVTLDRTTQWLTVSSSGPDELKRTEDDVEASVLVYLPSPPVTTPAGTPVVSTDGSPAFAPPAGSTTVPVGMAGGPALTDNGAPLAPGVATEDAPASSGGEQGPTGVAVRKDFRETVYVNPSLVTDENGTATVSFPLAHSISTWRASAEGSTTDGALGTARTSFRTFQSFFVDFDMPTDLTRGDELEVPVVVYNYLTEETTVTVSAEGGEWLEWLSASSQELTLGPSEVRSVRFAMRVTEAGEHTLTLRGEAGETSDAVIKDVRIRPNGEPDDATASGTLDTDGATHSFTVPDDAIEGGTSLRLTLTPGFAADAAKGIDGMLQEPNGCFEQTTATAWPNTMVVHYLDQTGQLTEEKRDQALALLTRGYQRLLTFESPTGGYNWWGDAEPGNRILSAIMLWHLKDLESLIEVDAAVRDRTLTWLLAQQQPDGTWTAGDALHAGNEDLGTGVARTTAFIAWALAHTGWAEDAVTRATEWLRGNLPGDDFYATALVGNALAKAAPTDQTTLDVLSALDGLKQSDDQGHVVWQSGTPSWTGASGDSTAVETTGLVAYGMIQAGAFTGSADGAVKYILASKDSLGTWYDTQATMNALRTLSAAAKPDTSGTRGTLSVWVNGELAQEIDVTPDQSDVYRSFDLSAFSALGENSVELQFEGEGQVNYQVTRRAYLPTLPPAQGPLSLDISYDKVETVLGQAVTVSAVATNNDTEGQRDQVLVRIGRAPGFEPDQQDLTNLVASGLVSRFEVRRDDVTLYLMGLLAGEARALTFRLTPTLVVDAIAPSSSVYAYYQPSLVETVAPQRFVVTAQ